MKKVILLASLVLVFGLTACTSKISEQPKDDTNKPVVKEEVKVKEVKTEDGPAGSEDKNLIDISGWRDFESKIINVDFKFHKNWYYEQYKGEGSQNTIAYFVFTDDPDRLGQETSFPIEFFVSDFQVAKPLLENKDDYTSYVDGDYSDEAKVLVYEWKKGNVKGKRIILSRKSMEETQAFVFTAYDEKHFDILDGMASTFKFSNDEE